MDVHYTGMPASTFRPGIPVVIIIRSDWTSEGAVSEDHLLREGMTDFLSGVASDISKRLTPLASPMVRPWGVIRLIPTEMPPGAYPHWKITSGGIYIPIPRGSMTATLRIAMNVAATASLRYFRPVDDL